MVEYHYLDASITFVFMTLAMITGVLILLVKKYNRLLVLLHIVFAVAAYIAMIITILRAPKF